jgi:hypothetical protein
MMQTSQGWPQAVHLPIMTDLRLIDVTLVCSQRCVECLNLWQVTTGCPGISEHDADCNDKKVFGESFHINCSPTDYFCCKNHPLVYQFHLSDS